MNTVMKTAFLAIMAIAVLTACSAQTVSGTGSSGGSGDTIEYPAVYVSVTGSDANNGTNKSAPVISFTNAVALALAYGITNIYSDTSVFTPGTGINGSGTGLVISNTGLNFEGGWAAGFGQKSGYTTLSGAGTLQHVVIITNTSNISMSGFAIVRGNGAGLNGGGMLFYQNSFCNLTNIIASNNIANWGSAFYAERGSNNTVNLNCYFNSVGTSGTAVFARCFDYNITGNFISNQGSGVWFEYSTNLTIKAKIQTNYAPNGAGMYLNASARCTIDSEFVKNSASSTANTFQGGGGIYIFYGYGHIIKGYFTKNTAYYAAGIYVYNNANSNIIQSAFSNNYASGAGGGIYLYNSRCNVISSILVYNFASVSAGGIGDDVNSTNTIITNCLIQNNAPYGLWRTGGSNPFTNAIDWGEGNSPANVY